MIAFDSALFFSFRRLVLPSATPSWLSISPAMEMIRRCRPRRI